MGKSLQLRYSSITRCIIFDKTVIYEFNVAITTIAAEERLLEILHPQISESAAGRSLVARQPILNPQLSVIAHELLYRSVSEARGSAPPDGSLATARVIVDSCLEIGLDRLTGSVPAHINFPRQLLISDAPLPVDPRRVVIEVLESVRVDADVIAALSTWRQRDGSRRSGIAAAPPGRSAATCRAERGRCAFSRSRALPSRARAPV